MTEGWTDSAAAWIADQGEHGDFGRRFVLDPPMLARIEGRGFRNALDVGCGEGRFCRMLRARALAATGLDPTAALLAAARQRDPDGHYVEGLAEAMPFPDGTFDLVVSYLSLIDIAGLDDAVAEMARVLAPGGSVLIANLNGFASAVNPDGWQRGPDGVERFVLDRYLEERSAWAEWRGIRVRNWHRPLSRYMQALLGHGLHLVHFDEPEPGGGPPEKVSRYRRVPWFLIMEWQKPGVSLRAGGSEP